MKNIIKIITHYFINTNLCNRKCCYRIVTRKNGVCDFCKTKKIKR